MKRWRQVQSLDEAWQYEEMDPCFHAKAHDAYAIDGWRPLGFVWNWAKPSSTQRPWRGSIGPHTNRDYPSLKSAQRYTERRLDERCSN